MSHGVGERLRERLFRANGPGNVPLLVVDACRKRGKERRSLLPGPPAPKLKAGSPPASYSHRSTFQLHPVRRAGDFPFIDRWRTDSSVLSIERAALWLIRFPIPL